MIATNRTKGFTIRIEPELLLRAKKTISLIMLKTEKGTSLNDFFITAIKNECNRKELELLTAETFFEDTPSQNAVGE